MFNSDATASKIVGNIAQGVGGGFYAPGTLNNCLLLNNGATYCGGAIEGTLNNCTIAGNSGGQSGGDSASVLNNCIIFNNSAP